jgi:prophage tail gpP-like protein
LAAAALLASLTACGTSLTLKTGLQLVMTGVLDQAVGATGNADPKYEGFVLKSAAFTAPGGTTVSMYDGPDLSLRIIDRPQIIADKDLTSYANESITDVVVVFGSTVTAGGKYSDDLAATLTNPTQTYSQAISVTQDSMQQLTINVQWENSITRDDSAKSETLQEPSFELDLGSD